MRKLLIIELNEDGTLELSQYKNAPGDYHGASPWKRETIAKNQLKVISLMGGAIHVSGDFE